MAGRQKSGAVSPACRRGTDLPGTAGVLGAQRAGLGEGRHLACQAVPAHRETPRQFRERQAAHRGAVHAFGVPATPGREGRGGGHLEALRGLQGALRFAHHVHEPFGLLQHLQAVAARQEGARVPARVHLHDTGPSDDRDEGRQGPLAREGLQFRLVEVPALQQVREPAVQAAALQVRFRHRLRRHARVRERHGPRGQEVALQAQQLTVQHLQGGVQGGVGERELQHGGAGGVERVVDDLGDRQKLHAFHRMRRISQEHVRRERKSS